MNWYKKYKIAWNRGIPIMEDFDARIKNRENPYKQDPESLVYHAPFLGGEKRKGYPKDISFIKDEEESQIKTLPIEDTLINTETSFGEGAGAEDKLERFVDPIDKLHSFDEKPEPTGPHNMQESNFYDRISILID